MSAPPGWHPQDDGRERFWDGQQWTEQFRTPAGLDPTAPPPPPSWASSDGTSSPSDTQAMDVGSTQQLPTVPPAAADTPAAATYGAPEPSAYPAAHPPAATPRTGYGSPGYGGGGYGAAGDTGWQPPQKSGGSGLLKGCLIAVVVGIVVLVGVVVAGLFFFNRAVEDVQESFPSFPSDLPTTLPSDLPTDGLGQTIQVPVGGAFEVPRAQILDGWALDDQGALGVDAVQVRDMRAEITDGEVPVFFTMSFPTAGGGTAETVCTSQSPEGAATVDVQCVPIFGDVADAQQATVTTAF